MIRNDAGSTFYFGKVDYKQKNVIYFDNLLYEKTDGIFANNYESIVLPEDIKVMVYDESKAQLYRVSYEDSNYMSYSTMIDENDKYPISAENIESYYILAREEDGKLTDVVYYCYTEDISDIALPYF